jgi:transposase
MPHLSVEAKHHILLEYTPHDASRGFAALARRHAVKGGADVVRRWHQRWDKTSASLQRKPGSGKAPILNPRQVQQHVQRPIRAANRAHKAVHYSTLLPSVQEKTGTELSLRTLQRYGKEELGAKQKHTKKRTSTERQYTAMRMSHAAQPPGAHELTLSAVAAELCEDIAQMRRKLQRCRVGHVLFLDEAALRTEAAPTHTITLPDEQPLVLSTDTTSYAPRYDMIACCTSDRVLLPKIYSPQERSDAGVKGINGATLHQFIDDTLAQAVEGLDRYPLTLVLDRAPIHTNTAAILQAFRDRGSQSITEILLMPPNAAKRLSPLDNALFHDWKDLCRKRCPVTKKTIEQVMADAWNQLPARLLRSHFKHCGLTRGADPYSDCPDPSAHLHGC